MVESAAVTENTPIVPHVFPGAFTIRNLSPFTGAGETAALTTTPEPMEVTATKDAPLVWTLPLGQSLHLLLPTGAVRPAEQASHEAFAVSLCLVSTAHCLHPLVVLQKL